MNIRTSRIVGLAGVIAGCWLSFAACAASVDDEGLRKEALSELGLLPAIAVSLDAPMARLGRELFWDTRLSGDGRTACASCHHAADWGADRRPFSPDARRKLTSRNSQTVFNSMLQPSLRWTGDRKSGAHQAERSLTGSMGFNEAAQVVPLLQQHGYEKAFKSIWPNEPAPLTPTNYAKALEAYQSTLVTPSAFDRFLEGNLSALTTPQKAGLRVFLDAGCADCHSGPLLGGKSLRKFGVRRPYWEATKSSKQDLGLAETTKKEEDHARFRVSMLRNIAKTGPYFHDGSVSDLPGAVQVMAEVQLGNRLSEQELKSLVEFLESLTGEVPANFSPPSRETNKAGNKN